MAARSGRSPRNVAFCEKRGMRFVLLAAEVRLNAGGCGPVLEIVAMDRGQLIADAQLNAWSGLASGRSRRCAPMTI